MAQARMTLFTTLALVVCVLNCAYAIPAKKAAAKTVPAAATAEPTGAPANAATGTPTNGATDMVGKKEQGAAVCEYAGTQYVNGDTWSDKTKGCQDCRCVFGTTVCQPAILLCTKSVGGTLPCNASKMVRAKDTCSCDTCPKAAETCSSLPRAHWFREEVDACKLCHCENGKVQCLKEGFKCSPCRPGFEKSTGHGVCSCPTCLPVENTAGKEQNMFGTQEPGTEP
eukprot:scpid96331/ scgid14002/ 